MSDIRKAVFMALFCVIHGWMRWSRKRKTSKKSHKSHSKQTDPLQIVSQRLKTCDDALKKNPDDPDALFTKAVFLARIHEYKRAIDCLERVIDINEEYPMVWGVMSLVYSRMGDFKNAKTCREKSQLQKL